VYRRLCEQSDSGKFTTEEFKDSLILLFDEVSKHKLQKLEALIHKKNKLVSKVVVNGSIEDKDCDLKQEISEMKAKIEKLKNRTPEDTYEDAMKWLGIDVLSPQ